jgi:hypothetical protein
MGRARHITPQGFGMLVYSNVLILLTLGISLLLKLIRLIRMACEASTHPCPKEVLVRGKSLVYGEADQDYRLRLQRPKTCMRMDISAI